MKKYILSILIVLAPLAASAQNKVVEQLFQKYSGKEGYTSVVITKNMFQLFANVENPDNDEFLKTIKNLEFIKILSAKTGADGKVFYNEVLSLIPVKDYKELMVIQEADEVVKFLTLEKDGVIRELLMISSGKEESTVIWMAGIIDMKTVSKIAQNMKIEGMDDLEKVKKE
jgi:hypothetical protein